MSTVICICTYRRPAGLQSLLTSLQALQDADDVSVVVIDNDAQAEGRAVCRALPADYPYKVHAQLETTSGISYARNAAASLALSLSPQLVAFLDDDEQPCEQWLRELKRIQREHNADIVGGPTLSVFPPETDEKTRQNPYFGADLQIEDGATCQLQAAGNFLIRSKVLASMAPTFFHPAFAESGGEDLAFFTRLGQQGASMHWAAKAQVHESVPANRLTDAWMKSRVVNIANSRVRVMQMLKPGLLPALERGLKTCALFTLASVTSALGLIHSGMRSKARLLRWKFWGKLTAHLKMATTREEGH